MECIVGLGNINKHLELTRHNIGFEVVDHILEKSNFSLDRQKFRGACTIGRMSDDKVLLIEPMTMMSSLGETTVPIMDYYSVNPEDLIILRDDSGLEQGQVRLRRKGSAGGHNGMKSIIKMFGIDQFKRIRISVGRTTNGMVVPDYVLQHFSNDEMATMEKVVEHAARTIEEFVETSRFDRVVNESSGEVK